MRWWSPLPHPTTILADLRPLGGAVTDVPEKDTAWADRKPEALVSTWVRRHGPEAEDASFDPIAQLGSGTYGAYASDTRPAAADRHCQARQVNDCGASPSFTTLTGCSTRGCICAASLLRD
jgi:hypothetical protein